jgi:hypothetical protein
MYLYKIIIIIDFFWEYLFYVCITESFNSRTNDMAILHVNSFSIVLFLGFYGVSGKFFVNYKRFQSFGRKIITFDSILLNDKIGTQLTDLPSYFRYFLFLVWMGNNNIYSRQSRVLVNSYYIIRINVLFRYVHE